MTREGRVRLPSHTEAEGTMLSPWRGGIRAQGACCKALGGALRGSKRVALCVMEGDADEGLDHDTLTCRMAPPVLTLLCCTACNAQQRSALIWLPSFCMPLAPVTWKTSYSKQLPALIHCLPPSTHPFKAYSHFP